jgi:hypothetical protein
MVYVSANQKAVSLNLQRYNSGTGSVEISYQGFGSGYGFIII